MGALIKHGFAVRTVAACFTRCHRLKADTKTWRLWGWDVTSEPNWPIYHTEKLIKL